jgi:hypothetical protein
MDLAHVRSRQIRQGQSGHQSEPANRERLPRRRGLASVLSR